MTDKPKAIFFSGSASSLKNVYPDYIRDRLDNSLDFFADMTSFGEEETSKRSDDLKQVEYLFSTWGMPHLSRDYIKSNLPKLKVLFYGAGSVQSFAREFLEEGITVVSAWAANAVPVAEFTVSQIMLCSKGYFQRLKKCSADSWENRKRPANFEGMYNTKIGIIGAGMIGRLVINMLKAYKCEIFVFDPFLPDEKAAELNVTKTSLEYIFENCAIITNHLANNPQTIGMLNGKLFSLMRPNAAFINTGRGAQVVESDLADAMRECPERVALLDVTMPEPPVEGSDLYKLDNVYLSPHIAGSLGREVERMGEYMCDELENLLAGRALRYSVSLEMLKTMA